MYDTTNPALFAEPFAEWCLAHTEELLAFGVSRATAYSWAEGARVPKWWTMKALRIAIAAQSEIDAMDALDPTDTLAQELAAIRAAYEEEEAEQAKKKSSCAKPAPSDDIPAPCKKSERGKKEKPVPYYAQGNNIMAAYVITDELMKKMGYEWVY